MGYQWQPVTRSPDSGAATNVETLLKLLPVGSDIVIRAIAGVQTTSQGLLVWVPTTLTETYPLVALLAENIVIPAASTITGHAQLGYALSAFGEDVARYLNGTWRP